MTSTEKLGKKYRVTWTIKKSDYVGRYMVAARDIKPGEAIFADQPACIGNFSNLLHKYLSKLSKQGLKKFAAFQTYYI